MTEGHCVFHVTHQVRQLSPITSENAPCEDGRKGNTPDNPRRRHRYVWRRCLCPSGYDYVILIDNLEHARRENARAIYDRYRQPLDLMLRPLALQTRASVHFLVNMLEAYYFAHAATDQSGPRDGSGRP